jgi:hypothetical protein
MVTHDRAPDQRQGADVPSGLVPACAGPEAARAAAAAWRLVVPALAGQPLVRVSPDGGRTYPRGRVRTPLTAELPAGPATVPVYDEDAGTGRLLALDFDTALAAKAGAADPAAEVAAQAAAAAAVTAGLGGRSVTDVSPSAGRHVYILFAVPLPWRELRDLAKAMRRRYPALDPMPMASPQSGQIRPPGSPHKSGGWSVLAMPLQDAVDAVARPCGRAVWAGLLDEFAAELEAAVPAAGPGMLPPGFAAGDDGTPWRPRPGGRIPVSPRLDQIARTGAWPAGRYPGRSEARAAVLLGAAACGWRLADVRAVIAGGRWAAMDGLYARPGEPARMHRLLAAEWLRAVAHLAENEPPPEPAADGGRGEYPRNWHTSPDYPRAPLEEPRSARAEIRSGQLAVISEYGEIRRWVTATDIAAADPARTRRWGRQAITIRLVLTALAQAAVVRGSKTIAFGTRNVSLHSGVSWRTVGRVLEELRSEPDPLVELVSSHFLKRADVYVLRIPDAYAEAASWRRRRAGWITAIHPAFTADTLKGTAALTYAVLTSTAAPAAEVARTAQLGETATADALRALAADGLAEKGPRGWTRGPASLDDVALSSGAMAAHAELADRYGKERSAWHEKIAGWLNGPEPVIPDDPEQLLLADIPPPAGPAGWHPDDAAWDTTGDGEAPAAVAVRTAAAPVLLSARRQALHDIAAGPRAGQAPLGSATVLVTAAGGRRAVLRTVDPGPDGAGDDIRYLADGEELAALAGEAIGAPVAAAWRQGPGRVWSEYLEGRPAEPSELAGSPAAALIGLLDAVTDYRDRCGHLIVTPGGTLAGFGGSGAWLPWETSDPTPAPCEPGAPAALYITPDGRWRDDPPVTRVTAASARARIEALRPAFRARGREQWLVWTLARLADITRRAPATTPGPEGTTS